MLRKLGIGTFELARTFIKPSHWRVILRDLGLPGERVGSDSEHLQAAMDWLSRAQDASGCGGVAAGYFFQKGWMPPYPETTGYIIPTFLRFGSLYGNGSYLARAQRMGDWEIEVQLSSGAVRGGIGLNDYPVVFNTGQVILGWTALYGTTSKARFLDAAVKAADWLLSVQDADGKWSRHTYMNVPHAYHSRVAWSLLEVYKYTRCERYRAAAERNTLWVLSQAGESGWFRLMGFSPHDPPFTHTVAYTLRGLMEAAPHLGDSIGPRVMDSVAKAAEKIMLKYENRLPHPDRDPGLALLPATLDHRLESRDSYSCLTGNAQLAIIWLKLGRLNGDLRLTKAALRLLNQVKGTQLLECANPGIRGGIAGSHPIWGQYVPYAYPSWAAKFFADGLILKSELGFQTDS